MRSPSLVALLVLLSSCAPQRPSVDASAERARLLDIERSFAHESEEKGTAVAFRAFLADDAVELAGGAPVKGREAVASRLEDTPGHPRSVLQWAPVDGTVSGDLGYTWGTYTFTASAASEHGKYLSVWRRTNGVWKVIADIGTPDTK